MGQFEIRFFGRPKIESMRKPKRARDTNELAAQIVGLATGDVEEARAPDPKAVKRGEARAATLTRQSGLRSPREQQQHDWVRRRSFTTDEL